MNNPIRAVVKELVIGKQIQGSIGDFETQEEKQKIDSALTSIAKIIEKEKKYLFGGGEHDPSPMVCQFNDGIDHIVKMIRGGEK